MATKKRLSFREYWNAVGTENIEKLCARIDSGMPYMRALKYGKKLPAPNTIARIISAAKVITPGWEPDAGRMLSGDEDRPGRLIKPSDEFVRSVGERARKALVVESALKQRRKEAIDGT